VDCRTPQEIRNMESNRGVLECSWAAEEEKDCALYLRGMREIQDI